MLNGETLASQSQTSQPGMGRLGGVVAVLGLAAAAFLSGAGARTKAALAPAGSPLTMLSWSWVNSFAMADSSGSGMAALTAQGSSGMPTGDARMSLLSRPGY